MYIPVIDSSIPAWCFSLFGANHRERIHERNSVRACSRFTLNGRIAPGLICFVECPTATMLVLQYGHANAVASAGAVTSAAHAPHFTVSCSCFGQAFSIAAICPAKSCSTTGSCAAWMGFSCEQYGHVSDVVPGS